MSASAAPITFSATVRSRRVSCALYTSPMPPLPSDAVTLYGPRRVPGESVIGRSKRSVSRSGVPQPQIPQQPMQVCRVDPEEARSRREIAAGAIDRIENEAALRFEHRLMVGRLLAARQ